MTEGTKKRIFLVILLFSLICFFLILKIQPSSLGTADYWVNFLTSILTNLIVLGIALFFIDEIVEKSKREQFQNVNRRKAEFIRFSIDRFLFRLLVSLGLLDEKEYMVEATKGEDLNTELFIDMPSIYIKKLNSGEFAANLEKKIDSDPIEFLKNLVSLINKHSSVISNELDKIYPQPDPNLTELMLSITAFRGAPEGLMAILNPSKSVLNEMGSNAKNDMKKLLKDNSKIFRFICFQTVFPQFKVFFEKLLKLRVKAEQNSLHLFL